MGTLIKSASVGTAVHEWMHTWYQMLMGSNESLYPWMDEGFTDYSSTRVLAELNGTKGFPYEGSYRSYISLTKSPFDEPASTHSDHYNTNLAYSTSAIQ